MLHKSIDMESKSFKVSMFSWNVFLHVFTGVIVAIPIAYALSFVRNNQIYAIYLHILLLVPGFQLLMGQSFLGLCPYNSWSTELNTVEKRRAHWIIAMLSSILVIIGSFYMMYFKNINFNTMHGITGLVALVFTTVTIFSGVAALYPSQFKSKLFLPIAFSKISHILLGLTAFVMSGVSLCYSYDKNAFKNWIGADAALACIILTAIFTILLSINPMFTTYRRFKTALK
ncbi:unnamed protein product [Chrysodeixis includens]|uniref:ascorbate ferrireductase (transmembrane) n=1 Tax=Chrysodeixis includens TaxID=689277 RepID=A0A9P0G030_CHRIL|nr:unnamed protein product [Chrysodeixis includens]